MVYRSMLSLMPATEQLLRAITITDVLQLVGHNVVKQIGVLLPFRKLSLNVPFDSLPRMRTLKADNHVLLLSSSGIEVTNQVTTPPVPADPMSIGKLFESFVNRTGTNSPARAAAYGVAFDMLHGGGKEPEQPSAGAMNGRNKQRPLVLVYKKPVFGGKIPQARIGRNPGWTDPRVVTLGQADFAGQQFLQVLPLSPAGLGGVSKHPLLLTIVIEPGQARAKVQTQLRRSEEHTSELQSQSN